MGVNLGQQYLPEPLKKQLLSKEPEKQTILSSVHQVVEGVAKIWLIYFTALYRGLYW